jgi:hypothetical protein
MIEFKSRSFVLPVMAVLAKLHGPADRGSSRPEGGATVRIVDPDIGVRFDELRRAQCAAAKIC